MPKHDAKTSQIAALIGFYTGDELSRTSDPAQPVYVLPPGAIVLSPAQARALAHDPAGPLVAVRRRAAYFDAADLAAYRTSIEQLERIVGSGRYAPTVRSAATSALTILQRLLLRLVEGA